MATPSLQALLAAVPALAEQIDGMNELTPGVLASEENLRTLSTYMNRELFIQIAIDQMLVVLQLSSKRKGVYQDLRVQVQGPPEECRLPPYNHIFQLRSHICEETHKNTSEGLLQCLPFARQSLKRYRDEGPCPDCRSAKLAGTPVQKLRAIGMPCCEKCMFSAVVASESASACKRARSA